MSAPNKLSPPYLMLASDNSIPMTSAENKEKELKAQLTAQYGEVMTTEEMRAKYEVISFCAPCVSVERRADHKRGTLEFTHMPRFYFDFVAE